MSPNPEDDPRQARTIRQLIDWGAARLEAAGAVFGHGTDNAHDEAVLLVCHALGLPANAPRRLERRAVGARERELVVELVRRRIEERIPAAYLTGEAWFAGLPFAVEASVAIPRSPIAELIEDGFAPWYPGEGSPILDLCTGSGCIAVACAVHLPDARVDAVEISPPALELARRNAERHGVSNRVEWFEGDLFGPLPSRRYGLIVSNPPYVGAAEMASLPPEYLHEPALALISGADGLDLPLRILAGSGARLIRGGSLILEVGAGERALTEALPGVPFVWLEFRRGGHGVLVLTREELLEAGAMIREELARRGLKAE